MTTTRIAHPPCVGPPRSTETRATQRPAAPATLHRRHLPGLSATAPTAATAWVQYWRTYVSYMIARQRQHWQGRLTRWLHHAAEDAAVPPATPDPHFSSIRRHLPISATSSVTCSFQQHPASSSSRARQRILPCASSCSSGTQASWGALSAPTNWCCLPRPLEPACCKCPITMKFRRAT